YISLLFFYSCFLCVFFFFFFQAEDGIRDFHVTGVQTCALPISGARTVSAGRSGLRSLFLNSALMARPAFSVKPPTRSISRNQDKPMVTVKANRKMAINSSVVAGRIKKRTMASDTAVPRNPPDD